MFSAKLYTAYFHHSSFCTVAAEYRKFIAEKDKEFNDTIIVEVENMRSKIILKFFCYNFLKNALVDASVSLHLLPNIPFTSGYGFKMVFKEVQNVRMALVCCTNFFSRTKLLCKTPCTSE